MKTLFLILLISVYVRFIWAAMCFFSTPDSTARRSKGTISALGSISMLLQIGSVYCATISAIRIHHVFAFISVSLSLVLFQWIQKTLKKQKLNFAFSKNTPLTLIQKGPYRFIRHPIYLAYTLAWIGGFAFTPTWTSAFPLMTLVPLYFTAIAKEERQFLSGRLAHEYSVYQKRTGRLIPRVFG